MIRTAVLNVVGLTTRLLDSGHLPFLRQWAARGRRAVIEPALPAVTCSVQATYLTGKWPAGHGIVGNGWYFRTECEIKFWRQSNKLVQADKVWDVARRRDPSFTCANLFWWYNMYSTADYSVTPRPNYLANGLKIPDVYSHPAELRDRLQQHLGQFPLFSFWGPNTNIDSTKWIAESAKLTEEWHSPTLSLVYLPHLDYNFQRHGHNHPSIPKDLQEIDDVCRDLITFYEGRGIEVIVLSEYGITDVSRPIHLNRALREAGLIAVRREQTWELLDAGASTAFAVADHQVAHVYVNDKSKLGQVRGILERTPGIELILDETTKPRHHLDHARSGDFVVFADADSWFSYYYWLDDRKAPDYARIVDIHRKPGYDPVELFVNPDIRFPKLKIGATLARKMLGFRYLMDVIPLDATLVKGSHGRRPEDEQDWPVVVGHQLDPSVAATLAGTAIKDIILDRIFAR